MNNIDRLLNAAARYVGTVEENIEPNSPQHPSAGAAAQAYNDLLRAYLSVVGELESVLHGLIDCPNCKRAATVYGQRLVCSFCGSNYPVAVSRGLPS